MPDTIEILRRGFDFLAAFTDPAINGSTVLLVNEGRRDRLFGTDGTRFAYCYYAPETASWWAITSESLEALGTTLVSQWPTSNPEDPQAVYEAEADETARNLTRAEAWALIRR